MERNYFVEQELSQMRVMTLRDCARKIGVSSPTTKTKQELIDSYLEIAKGNATPKRSKRGRPPKDDSMVLRQINGFEPMPKNKSIIKENQDEIQEELQKEIQEEIEKEIEKDIEEEIVPEEIIATQAKAVLQPQNNSNKKNYNNNYGYNQNNRNTNQQAETKDVDNIAEMLRNGECEKKFGLLDIHPDGYGFLRAENCEYGNKDAYVSAKLIKVLGLRPGDMVVAVARKNAENKPSAVISVETVNGNSCATLKARPNFDKMVPIYPNERLKLETGNRGDFAIRCIDLIAPIGKGQRAMIVSPPKAGKTTLLKKIASAIANNHPEVELFVLLVDERPEEVTDMKRSINGEVIYSTFDETPEHHCKSAELLIERAKREVELGKDVVIIMDSLTRLARAYNLTIPPTGRTLSGGMDPGALHNPKRFFGSARNIENGGSLTIIATALIDTGSRMDDVIYEEFKGTGNMEIHLDRKLSERRIFPAIDLNRSSTRREDLLLTQKELEGVWAVRKMLSSAGENGDMTEQLINLMVKTKNNVEFIDNVSMQMKMIEKNGYNFRK